MSSIAGSENFPNASYAESEFVISTGTFTYTLYSITPISYSAIAQKTGTNAWIPENNYYFADNAVLSLPFNYQQTFPLPTSTGSHSVTYDGYGTFISSLGTIENVVKLTQTHGGTNMSGPGYQVHYFFSTNPCKLIARINQPYAYSPSISIYSYTPSLEISKNKIESFSIYPNPTADFFTIKTVDLVEKGAIIRIYDLVGNLLLSNSLDSDLKRISIENFSSGIFIINITDKNNKILYTDKIIKR